MPIERKAPRRVYGIYRSASVTPMEQKAATEPPAPNLSGTLSRSQSVSQIEMEPFGVAGATYIPFHTYSACKPIMYRTNRYFTLRDYLVDKYYYFSPRYRRTQFHRHYYHGQVEHYPYKWNFESKGTITGQYYWVRRLQFDPIQYGSFRYYDPYRRYYDPYHDSYMKLYNYRPKLMESLY